MKEYGITTSKAHVWVHVCPLDAAFYWYNRRKMITLMAKYPTAKIATAQGHLVRLFGNRACDGGVIMSIDRPYKWFGDFGWKDAESDSAVGAIAESMFSKLVSEHGFPYPLTAVRYDDKEDQFQGKDYRLEPVIKSFDVEIKADIKGGEWGISISR